MPEPKPEALKKPVLFVVEGKDDERFFQALVASQGLDERVQVYGIGGRSNLSQTLKALKNTPGFDQIRHLIIVRDADEDPGSAFQSGQNALRQAGLPIPQHPLESTHGTVPVVTVILLPGGSQQGTLEDLCLKSVAGDPAIPCVEAYFECLNQRGLGPRGRKLSKAKVHVFLASREEPGLRLGEAADRGYWPWDAAAFKEIRQFLESIR